MRRVKKVKSDFERYGKRGFYVDYGDSGKVIKVKSTSANAPKAMRLKSVWVHPDYAKLKEKRVTRTVTKRFGVQPKQKKYYK